MRTGESFWCDDTEYELIYLDGCIPFYTPIYQDEDLDCLDYDERAYLQGDYDEEVYEDDDVQKAIEDSMKHELKKIVEHATLAQKYLQKWQEEETQDAR